ncbi:MAG TPA: FlgD immunoglobulin-like domain containing protein, partial [Flavobacteriales bacterium]|nr:FlgD immunoglobulin-like domain containing protein [Flavobacteriales bacterium]
DNITSIAISETTGEVFFGTDRGIVGYRGDAIEGGKEASCANVFPNPVRESYTGPIAVTGLVRDSEVKITDVSGNIVYRTTSLGGQATWNGNDMSGNRVATGVYLIFASDLTGAYKCNTKVMVVR